jgi:hypothetical protein
LVDQCLCDPVRLFVKQEPHKQQKIKEQRWRLISSVSFLDGIIERYLYTAPAKDEIEHWRDLPSKPGMGSSDQDFIDLSGYMNSLLNESGGLLDTDIKAWDWQRKWWIGFVTVLSVIIELGYDFDSDYANICFAREYVASKAAFAFSDGTLVQSGVFGIMCSGRYVTSYFNSKGRTSLCTIVGTKNMAMGDDCIEGCAPSQVDVVLKGYSSLGYDGIIEHRLNTTIDGAIFCSMRYSLWAGYVSATPVNWTRTLYRLLSKEAFTHSEWQQFLFEVRHMDISFTPALHEWARSRVLSV